MIKVNKMPIFKIQKSRLIPIKEKTVSLERNLQKLTEENLETIFGFQFVSSEFKIINFFVDTLVFDPGSRAFVIIEYKKDESFSVIDQGFAYLGTMLKNKADFILEYNEKTKSNLRRDDIDWSQSKVIFISTQFTPYQQNAISFRDLPIELWEVKIYDNETILYNQLKSPETKESIKTVSKSETIQEISQEVKTYTIEDHLKSKPRKIKDFFSDLRKEILGLGGEINEVPRKFYIGYKNPRLVFVSLQLYNSKIEVGILIEDQVLKDPKELAKKFPEDYGYAKNSKHFFVKPDDNFEYVLDLIKQSYEFNKGR